MRHEFVVAELTPNVNCSPRVGVRLLPRGLEGDPMRITDAHQSNADWIDPGYENSITCHPIRRGIPQFLTPGIPFVSGQVYVYDESVGRTYGATSLGSHYSGAEGGLVGSKS